MSVVLALVPAGLVLGVSAAGASPANSVAADPMSFGIGPVAVAAVVVGLGGLVTGLLRHRRRATASTTLVLDPVLDPVAEPVVEPVASERVA